MNISKMLIIMTERKAKIERDTFGFEVEYETLGKNASLSRSKLDTDKLILDVGCGTNPKGTVNVDIFRNGFNKQLGDQINGELMSAGTIDNFVLAHGESLPFKDESFDLVYSSHAIEHTQKPMLMLKEMCRIAKRKIIVKCPHRRGTGAKRPFHLSYLDEDSFYRASEKLSAKAFPFITLWDYPISNKIERILPQALKPLITKTLPWRALRKIERTMIRRNIFAIPFEMEVWINKNQKRPNSEKVVFVVCYNIPYIYETRFLSSPYTSNVKIEAKHNTEANNEDLPVVFNRIINEYVEEDVWLAFCHQDFILKEDLEAKLKDKAPGVYGVIGASYGYHTLRGQIIQTNERPIGSRVESICPVQTLDEMCIIVHSSLFRAGLRFDERFDFHFYGADLCMEAYRRGFDVYAMQVECQHKSRTLAGDQDTDSFLYCWKRFEGKWKNFLPIRTTTKLMVSQK